MQAHGGSVRASPVDADQTIFEFFIPARPRKDAERSGPRSRGQRLSGDPRSQFSYSPLTLRYDERPPSAAIVVPLTMRDSSEARNTAIAAMSSGSPIENG